jgi:hypothetical protein
MMSDLGSVSTIHALQINYADQDAEFMGKQNGIFHRYVVRDSEDGEGWRIIIDKSQNDRDVPHDYVELAVPAEGRFVRIENVHVPTGKFALSGFRVFGLGHGAPPDTVRQFVVLRGESERRNAWLKWQRPDEATGVVIHFGHVPGKLYNSVMVYGDNEYYCTALEKDRPAFFQIEPFNENGIGGRTAVTRSE